MGLYDEHTCIRKNVQHNSQISTIDTMTSSHIHRPIRTIVIGKITLQDIRHRARRAINICIVVSIACVPVTRRSTARDDVLLIRWVGKSEGCIRNGRDDVQFATIERKSYGMVSARRVSYQSHKI